MPCPSIGGHGEGMSCEHLVTVSVIRSLQIVSGSGEGIFMGCSLHCGFVVYSRISGLYIFV